MELRILKYFLMVAKEENITKAAKSLYITQPTLSRQLVQIEEELGVKLFTRSNHKILLTEDGKEAIELHPGDVVNIPKNVKHWHGAAKDSWFTHIALSDGGSTEWFGILSEDEYEKLPKAVNAR